MYSDSVKQWNVFVGCEYDCHYCRKSFQAQMKRQKHNCDDCYTYTPHFHPERLRQSLPKTTGDEFIWACSSGDITFAKKEWIEQILDRIRELPFKTFFFQSKNPKCFRDYKFPKNVLLGTTIESNRIYKTISKAPIINNRLWDFKDIKHPRKVVTIEPIMDFDYWTLRRWIYSLHPERVYVGYDTKKSGLEEPPFSKTVQLITTLGNFTKVKLKYLPIEVLDRLPKMVKYEKIDNKIEDYSGW